VAHINTSQQQQLSEGEPDKYCRYLPVTIGKTSCRALIDSGNLWRNVVSKDFLYQLGLTVKDLKPCAIQNVATAKRGANLAVLGEVRHPLKTQMGGLNIKFKTSPVVIEHLTMPVNINSYLL
jgi:hypothetical protein